MKRWYVAFTKPGGERLAETNLLRQGFEAYLPRVAKRRKNARVPTGVTIPLFPRYIFVRLDLENAPWRAVNSTFGISHLVSFGEKPAAISDDVIAEVRSRETEDGLVSLAMSQTFEPGEVVSIMEGAFEDRTGIFQCRTDKERVLVMLNLLGRELTVSVDSEAVQKVA